MLELNENENPPKSYNIGTMTASRIHINTSSEVITITQDKLRIALMENSDIFRSRDSWIAPLGIALTLLITLLTTDFKDFLLEKSVWKAVFYIALFVSLGWLLKEYKYRPAANSVDSLINKLKDVDIK
ncbi:hypothetical protein [Pseudomonas sp. 51_B]|uniref:hypothetical protein n=1 Tax=Pseudomonas sp. 51_B TaxID=2813573 RepID=UPI001A9F7971|nr:hypothetical protein [Pseudomonas sp. 51_B]